MRIEEEYKKTGYFWLPGKQENKIPGVLSIVEGGGIELEIVGHFTDDIEALHENEDLKRIIGHVEKDGLVTLDHCFYIQKNVSFGGISKSKILVNRAFSGAAWDEGEAVTFNTFSFSVDCLDQWINTSGIKVENDWDSNTATIKYALPEETVISLDNGIKLEICFAYTLPGFPNITEAKISQRAYFKLSSDQLLDLSVFITIAFKITNLMCFAMDEIVTLKKVKATSSEIQQEINGKNYPVPISIFYKSHTFSEKVPTKNWHDMLFSFRAIKSDARQVFNNWINAYEDLAPALGLYFSTKTGAHKYLDGKFLALAQGLETYHRRTSTETLMEKAPFEILVAEVLKGCPEDHVDWLKGRLAHGNEINLGKRLKRIIEPFKNHLGNSGERAKLLRKIVDTRNYLTHYSESLKEASASGSDLWVLCQKMEVIFNLHFLKVIGFTDKEVNHVIANSQPLIRKMNEIA
jgi:hypothetical protein